MATGIPERDYAAPFDSVSVCFSKGLGAPIGSALCGSREIIQRARRFRKMYGGGMRQAGMIAAGALYALEHHRERLAVDHSNARTLAEGLARLPGLELDPPSVETNIVFFRVNTLPSRDACPGTGAGWSARPRHQRGHDPRGDQPDGHSGGYCQRAEKRGQRTWTAFLANALNPANVKRRPANRGPRLVPERAVQIH